MDFSRALAIVRSGGVVSRSGWNGLTLGVVIPPDDSGLTPFLAVKSTAGRLVPWQPGQQELFAEDWAKVSQEDVGHG